MKARGAQAVLAEARIEERVAELLASEDQPADERAAWRSKQLDAMLQRLLETPFGRERLAHVSRFDELPVIDRATLQRHGARLRAADGPTVRKRTSGSTGRPVTVEHGAATVGYAAAARLRQLTWFGLSPHEHPQANTDVKSKPDDPPIRRGRAHPPLFLVNPYALDALTVRDAHRSLVEAGGVRLLGAESSLLEQWAAAYISAGLDGGELGARLAIVGGEMTFEGQRELGREVFGCHVAQMYGSHECPMIATECRAGSLHVNEEVVLVEILDPRGSPVPEGEWGIVHVSLLHNEEMPLLRYRLNDVAAWRPGSCPCGRTLRRLDLSIGRHEEMVRRRDGSLVHPRFIRTTLEQVCGDGLRSFHTVQEGLGSFTIEVENMESLSAPMRREIEREISRYLGEPASVRLERVSKAERSPPGKLRTFTYAPAAERGSPTESRA